MARIQNGYETKYRAMLRRVRPRELERGVQQLLRKANLLCHQEGLAEPRALEEVYQRLQRQLNRWNQFKELERQSIPGNKHHNGSPAFLCDAGLGGLARWLRAAGYEAAWPGDRAEDEALISEAARSGAILLTTDSMMMERRVLREGIVPALWVPPAFKMREQLALVLRELRLPLREPRCMHCGGELKKVDKDTVRERIPPRTWIWLNEYFECAHCHKLFWHGTHWQRIRDQLHALNGH
ncbi:MAG TPA: Mut7-C RNAse domain-containing protein [Verrucomicrobiae bacterium]|jgi:hypothetical protein